MYYCKQISFLNHYCRYKYPLEENVKENEAEDQRCLAKVEELLEAGESVYFFHPFVYLFTLIH